MAWCTFVRGLGHVRRGNGCCRPGVRVIAPKDTSSCTCTDSINQLYFHHQARPPKRAGPRQRACGTGLEPEGAKPRQALRGGVSLTPSRREAFPSPPPVNAAPVAVRSRPGRGHQPPHNGTSPHGPRHGGPRAQPPGPPLLPSPHEWLLPAPSPLTPPRWFRPPPFSPPAFPEG